MASIPGVPLSGQPNRLVFASARFCQSAPQIIPEKMAHARWCCRPKLISLQRLVSPPLPGRCRSSEEQQMVRLGSLPVPCFYMFRLANQQFSLLK
jgi:hypothetical protein